MSLVAIVGRPNVGKSTLFNRLVGERKAIVDATAGTTRDRHYGKTDWNGKEFSIIDTGGYTVNSEDIFEDEIRRQVLLAIDEADVILFLVEVRTGITDLDMLMADILRRTSKKVILVCNKVDNNDQIYSSHEFYALGLGDPYCISSMSGSGTGDLMDAILDALPVETASEEDEDLPHITIVGRPNVGKSSLTNALLGEERNIVTSIAGTTRDSIHTRYNKFGMDFYLVDTAGMRKKGKTMEDLEFYSVMRSIRAIENSDVCILMIDARQGLESQDLNIHNLIVRNRKGCVIVVNKWDLIEKDSNTMKEWTEFLRKKLAPFNDIPIIFTSVLNKQRIFDVLQTTIRVYQSRKRLAQRLQVDKRALVQCRQRHQAQVGAEAFDREVRVIRALVCRAEQHRNLQRKDLHNHQSDSTDDKLRQQQLRKQRPGAVGFLCANVIPRNRNTASRHADGDGNRNLEKLHDDAEDGKRNLRILRLPENGVLRTVFHAHILHRCQRDLREKAGQPQHQKFWNQLSVQPEAALIQFDDLHVPQIPDCEHRRQHLTDHGSYRRAHHAPVEAVNENGIENYVGNRTGDGGHHSKFWAAGFIACPNI